ncbi:thiamine pyrophosphokinase, partial [Rozella allomycis CSF55]
NVWENAQCKLCADGAANSLLAETKEKFSSVKFVPDAIIGDLDSLDEITRIEYQKANIPIIHDSCQDTTDLTKCLKYLEKIPLSNSVFVFGAFGGRVDQSLSSIHSSLLFNHKRIYLMNKECLSTVLQPGNSSIIINEKHEGPICGVLPIVQSKTVVSTTGLKWNLDNANLSYGSLISSSNKAVDTVVTITTNQPVLWTICFKNVS